MQTAAAYIRVSTEDQVEFSPASQLKKIVEYADSRGICLKEEYIFRDEGISGRDAKKRPQFQRMITAAGKKPKPFDIILVWKFSRFARNRQDSIFYKSLLRKECQVEVISVTEPLNDDPTSILIEALLEAMDEYYSINLAEEVRRGMNEKFSRGGVVSPPPFGYRASNGTFLRDEGQAPYVPLIFEEFVEGHSCRQIAVMLNDMGVRTSRGGLFESRSVAYILDNPAYIGKMRRRNMSKEEGYALAPGGYEALVSEELFAMARQKRMEHRREPCGRWEPGRFLLQGLARCSSCMSAMGRSGGGMYLQCCRYMKGQCGASHCVSKSQLEELVVASVIEEAGDIRLCLKPEFSKRAEGEHLADRARERELRKLRRVEEAYESGTDSLEEYARKKGEIEKRLCKLTAGKDREIPLMRTWEGSLGQALGAFSAGVLTEEEKNLWLKAVVAAVLFDRENSAVRLYYRTAQFGPPY